MFKQLLIISCFSLVPVCYCKPYILLTSSRNKCFNVVAPPGETIEIQYEAPDVDSVDYAGHLNAMNAPDKEESFGKDGMDSAYNKKLQRKLDRLATPGLSITISQKLQNQVSPEKRNDDKGRPYGVGRMREDCSKEGSLLFQTSEEDGAVNVCVHALGSSIDKPMRIYINVVVDEDLATDSYIEDGKQDFMQQAGEVKETMTKLERDFQSLTNRVRTIINSADYNKEQEVEFHEHSLAMNRAASYWPIIRLVFLFVTGLAQVNHIVGFMKAHRIS